MKGFRRSENRN